MIVLYGSMAGTNKIKCIRETILNTTIASSHYNVAQQRHVLSQVTLLHGRMNTMLCDSPKMQPATIVLQWEATNSKKKLYL